jgi:glucosyl-dolichyl phosphate glucuronosyltransferase
MLISVCVCTYNRAKILAHCLRSIGQLISPRPGCDIEIVVVDNNSNDDTADVVKRLVQEIPFEMRYVFEARQGLSAARNRAIDAARGDYLAFLDDECLVERDWLSIAISDIDAFHPCIIGGPYIGGFLPGDRPQWFKLEYGNAYFLEFEYEKGFQEEFRASGGNMIVRRNVFDGVRFDEDLGMKGNQLKVGEELDLQERFLRDHPSEMVFYEPAITVRHLIRPERLRLSYRTKRLFAHAMQGQGAVSRWQSITSLVKAMAHLTIAPARCLFRDRAKFPFWQNCAYEEILPAICYHLAAFVKPFKKQRASAV